MTSQNNLITIPAHELDSPPAAAAALVELSTEAQSRMEAAEALIDMSNQQSIESDEEDPVAKERRLRNNARQLARLNAHDEKELECFEKFLSDRGWADADAYQKKWTGRRVPDKYLPMPMSFKEIDDVGKWKPDATEEELIEYYKANPQKYMRAWHQIAVHQIYSSTTVSEKSIGYYKGILRSIKGITLALYDFERLTNQHHLATDFTSDCLLSTIIADLKEEVYLSTKKLYRPCGYGDGSGKNIMQGCGTWTNNFNAPHKECVRVTRLLKEKNGRFSVWRPRTGFVCLSCF
jgi:hypothetical protein